MKTKFHPTFIFVFFVSFSLLILAGCGGESADEKAGAETPEQVSGNIASPLAGIGDSLPEVTEFRENPSYRESADFKEWYPNEVKPPRKIDFGMDLSEMSYADLYFLKWEIMGQNGYMYLDDILRDKLAYDDYYAYYPVFWDENFTTSLSEEEENFIHKLEMRMERLQKTMVNPKGSPKVNTSAIVNAFQFRPELFQAIEPNLARDGFAIVPAKHEQLFHVYDANDYSTLPSFITTDLYLQVLHMFYQYLIRELEEEHFIGILTELSTKLHAKHRAVASTSPDPQVKAAAEFGQFYYGLALDLLTDKSPEVPASLKGQFKEEKEKIRAAAGQGSEFLKSRFFDYSLFKPRGHYTRTEQLGKYFRAMMWLQTAPLTEDNPVGFNAGLLSGQFLNSPELSKLYDRIFKPVRFIAGEPNKLSLAHVRDLLKGGNYGTSPEDLLQEENIPIVMAALKDVKIPGFKPKGANKETDAELQKLKLVTFPQRYTLDGEILSRMVEIKRDNLTEEPRRPVPKGLDVFAALGNEEAENLLMNFYKEQQKWGQFPDTLTAVRNKFKGFSDWNSSVYNKWMHGLKRLLATSPSDPYYMQSKNWDKRNLNTALGSWAELKHDMILYADQPFAAQMGAGGDWPPPYLVGYVEPELELWQNSLELLDLTDKNLKDFGLSTSNNQSKIKGLKSLAQWLMDISRKELRGEKLTVEEYDAIRYIGGRVESLTLDVMDSDVDEWYQLTGPDKFMAIVADVYSYQGNNKKVALEEGVGYGNEIYVVVEIEGRLYLTRGGVFSYHEFEQPIDQRLTDEEWQKMLGEGRAPATPGWMKDITVKVESPE